MLNIQDLKDIRSSHRNNKVLYNLLSTVIGECEQISKDPSEEQIISVMQKMYKDNEATMKECPSSKIDIIFDLTEENKFLSIYLPKPLADSELIKLIKDRMDEGEKMPDIMKFLTTNYKGRYDGKKAAQFIKDLSK
jgi:uncharacterized protein YqeY